MSSTTIRWFAPTTIPASATGVPRANAITTLPTRHAEASDKAFPTSAKKQIPHSSDLLAAGSFIHDFRTPPAPETLQDIRLAACACLACSGVRGGRVVRSANAK
jgi:hypothetical protein